MENKKAKVGVVLDVDILEKLDEIVSTSPYLGMSRSEIINVVSRAFFQI